jgi:hypothetical protein
MFYNIGGKIKVLAMVTTIIGIIFSVIFGIIIMTENFFSGLFLMLVLGVSSWVGSFMIYGFGELIECAQRIARNTRQPLPSSLLQSANATAKTHPQRTEPTTSTKILCPDCRQEIYENTQKCPYCGCDVQKYR